MLDKHTFGASPASIYLAEHLNELGDDRTSRLVHKRLSDLFRLLNELETANYFRSLSAHTVGSLINMAARPWANRIGDNISDKLTCNLMTNVAVGRCKDLERRVMVLRHRERAGYDQGEFSLSDVEDDITPKRLIERSLRKLKRKQKTSTYY